MAVGPSAGHVRDNAAGDRRRVGRSDARHDDAAAPARSGCGDSFAGAALQHGTYDITGQTPASRLLADQFFIDAYAGHAADRTQPDISPFYGDLRGLPPALLIVGSLDVLLEDNLVMAARLSAAGGDVDVRVYPQSPHGFTLHPTAMAAAALRGIESWLADRLLDA